MIYQGYIPRIYTRDIYQGYTYRKATKTIEDEDKNIKNTS